MKAKSLFHHSMLTLLLTVVVAVGAGRAGAALSSAKINTAPAGTGTAIPDLKTPPTLAVTATGHTAVWVTFTYKGATWRLPMTGTGGDNYSVLMPVMGAGTVSYEIYGGTAFDPYSDSTSEAVLPASGTYTYVNSETLSVQRQPDLAVWRSVTGDNIYSGNLDDGWRATSIGVNFDKTVNLAGGLAPQAEPSNPSLRTRSALTVGSIWIKAQFLGSEGEGTLFIEKSTSANPNLPHTLVEQLDVPYTSNWIEFRVDLNDDTPAYYRIRHPSGFDSNTIIIQDIVVTAPTPDVVLFKDEVDYSPGYPSRTDPVTFTVSATNVYAGTPAENISPKLVWRLNASAWTTTPMAPVGGDQYQVTLPAMDPGEFEYYYRADFTGYSYTGPFYPTGGNPADNIGDFSLWLNNNKIEEAKGPTYYPDFVNSHLYNLAVMPPVGIYNGAALQDPFDYLSFKIRRFRSRHDTMTLDFAPTDGSNLSLNPTYTMAQVGDYTWQAVINLTNEIDVATTIIGTSRYLAGDTEFDPVDKEWIAEDQDELSINPPMSGYAVDDGSGTAPIRIQMDYDGFMMVRFLSTNGYYEVRRAAWQDFNAWQANNEQFTSSFGLFETDVYESDLTGKSATVMPAAEIPGFEGVTTVSEDILIGDYINGLKVDRGWVIEESMRVVVDTVGMFNRALKLAASPQLRGSIETTAASATAGRDTLRMRVRASMDDDNHAVYMRGFDFENYTIVANTVTTSISDGDASISLLGYYQSANNYIEARVTQRRQTGTANRTYFELAIYQMKDGVLSLLKQGSAGIYNITSGYPSLLANNGQWRFELEMSSGVAQLNVFNSAGTQVGATLVRNFTIDANSIVMGGTVGVNSRDAVTKFKVNLTPGVGSAGTLSQLATSPQKHWDMGGTMAVTGTPRWTFVQGSSQNNPVELQRVVPAVKYRVSVYRNGTNETDVVAPVSQHGQEWDDDWDPTGTGSEEKSVNTFAYQNVSIPMHLWDNVFIKIAPTGSDGFLVVDDIAVDAWRGETLYDPEKSENDPDEEFVWKSTYAVITDYDSRGNMVYELNRSRANPVENQIIVSPLLNSGIGDILFNYIVTTGNVSFVVESLRQNGTVHQELMATNVMASAGPAMSRMYVSALTNITGRLRVRVVNNESSPDGVLLIDNLKATNYPDVGDLSWEAYNMLISTFDFNPGVKFDGAANVDFRSAVLNNSETADTPLNVSYDKDAPYLQSPKIETGIGEVSFWYRAYPVPSAGPGKIYLKAAKTLDGNPEWITLGVADLNPDASTYQDQVADMNGLAGITTEAWTYFSVEFYKSEYKFFRIYGEIGNGSRVMLDNVIVTEPVRTSIDIGTVTLIPDIPLYTDQVGAQVDLINPRMNPENIHVYLMWKTGTAPWGRENWEGSPSGNILLTQDPEQKYRFTVTNAIPSGSIDSVVQYAVKVVYSGTFAEPVYYGVDDFTNPSWYEPINLNEQFSESGHSPYYYRFSVGTNVVFINEFLPYGHSTFWGFQGLGEQYVELIGPENGNVANWKLEHIDVEASAQEDVAMWTNVFKPEAKFTTRFKSGSLEPKDKGWGFYTLACGQVVETNPNFANVGTIFVDEVLFPASLYKPDYAGFADANNAVALGVPGAMCLKRSMGAYADRIAWGSAVDVGNLVARGYKQLEARGSGSSNYRKVYMLTDDGDQMNPQLDWKFGLTTDYSPGYFNPGEAALIWSIDPASEEPSNPPEVAVQIAAIDVGATEATIHFSVASINDTALTEGDGFTWYVETSADVTFSSPVAHEIMDAITAPDSGAESSYVVEISLGEPVADAQFYRIKAVHP